MRSFYARFSRFIRKVLGVFPTRVPVKRAAFEAWVQSTLELYSIQDTPVYRNAIYGLIMHMGNTQNYKSKYMFARALRRAQLQETTYGAIQDLRAKEKCEVVEAAAPLHSSTPLEQTQKAEG